MKKTSKKILSMLMSIAMVVTMIPFSGIVANAAVKWTPIASSDFSTVSSVSNNTQISPSTYNGQGNSMSWTPYDYNGNVSKTSDSVAINDGYMYLSAYTGGSVPITGHNKWKIDFGFRFNTTNSGDDMYYNSDDYSFLKMYVYTNNLDHPNQKNAAYCYFAQNANGVGYSWEDDGHNVGVRSQSTSITTGNGNLSANTNYHYVAEFTGDRFKAYITNDSGAIVQTIINTTESTFISRLNNISSTTINSIKIGDDDNNYFFKGLEYRNLTFYSGSISSGGTTASDLKDLMNDYEAIMNSGSVYTNMSAAYKAYVDANEAYDAAVYGNNTAGISAAYSSLSTAIANMETWTPHTGTATATIGSTATNNNYNHLLYSSGTAANASLGAGNLTGVVYVPSKVVMYYNGTSSRPSFPVHLAVSSTSNNQKHGCASVYFVDSDPGSNTNPGTESSYYKMTRNWNGTDDAVTYDSSRWWFSIGYSPSNETDFKCDTTKHTRWFENRIYYWGTTNKETTSLMFKLHNQVRVVYEIATISCGIYVVNYYQLTNAINTKKSYLANVSNYKEGGLATLLEKYDNATGFDITKYMAGYDATTFLGGTETAVTDANASAYYTYANGACTKFASDINNASTPTADNANNYIKLRGYMDANSTTTKAFGTHGTLNMKQVIDDNDCNANTISNYAAFATAWNNAKNHMAALPATTNSSDYNGSTAASLATALYDAWDALATKSTAAVPTFSNEYYLGPNDSMTVASSESGVNGTVTYNVFYDGHSTSGTPDNTGTFSYNSSTNLTLFSSGNHTSAVITAYGTDVNGNTDLQTSSTYYFLSQPTVTIGGSNNILTPSDTVTVASSCGLNSGLKYSIDNGANWNDYSTPFAPFTLNASATSLTIKVKQVSGTSTSPVFSQTVYRKPGVPTITPASGSYIDADDAITISSAENTNENFAYSYSYYNNSAWTSYTADADANGSDVSGTTSATVSTPFVTAYSTSAQYLDTTETGVVYGYKIKAKSKRDGNYSDATSEYTYYLLTSPNIQKNSNSATISTNNVLEQNETVVLQKTNGFTGTVKFRVLDENNSNSVVWGSANNDPSTWATYTAAFNPFVNGNVTATKVTIEAVQYVSATSYSLVGSVSNVRLRPSAPTFTPSENNTYFDTDDSFTISVDSGADCEYSTDGGTTWTSYSGAVTPFSSKTNADGAATYSVKARTTRDSISTYVESGTITYKFLSTPTMNKANNAELLQTDVVTVTRTSGASGTLQYSINDGSGWSAWAACDGSNQFAPFNISGYQDDLVLQVKVREKLTDDTISPESAAVTLVKNVSAAGYYVFYSESGSAGTETSRNIFNTTGKFFISNSITSAYSGKTIYYQATADGVAGSFTPYNINDGINASSFSSNQVVTIKFYVISGGTTSIVAEGTFLKEGYDTLVYHETFNGSTSGSTYTAVSGGVNLDLGADGSIVSAAGDKNGPPGGASIADTTQDWRHNVLKIAGNTTTDTYVSMTSNPFAAEANKAKIKYGGATISFWRANESSGTNTANSIGYKGDGTTPNWRNAIAFRQGDANSEATKYYMVEMAGINSFMTTASTDFVDTDPVVQDVTTTAAGSLSGYWEHVAITINPNATTLDDAIIVYLNGVPHTTSVVPHGIYASGTDAQKAANTVNALLDFITDSNTYICFGNDNTWDKTSDDIYLDDIRVYAKPLTQKEVWESYYDNYSDKSTIEGNKFSVTHDPTNVTVYKLTQAVGGMAANSLVGQEFIDYHKLTSSQYTVDSYYSFGTGMTIYKSTDNIDWDIVGDSHGRVGYQNQDLFGSEYHTALSEALTKIDSLMDNPAAGNLVWAPHVMYNVSTNRWMMYVAISCWGDCKSIIVAMESSDGTLEHFKARDNGIRAYSYVVKSTGRPNAIDACPFYGHDVNGDIDPNTLYMTYGAWSGWGNGESGHDKHNDIAIMQLNSSGMAKSTVANGTLTDWDSCLDASSGKLIAASQPTDTTGEGSFVVYNNGYYYMYVSYGENTAGYNLRVFRSADPMNEDFVDMGGNLAYPETIEVIHGTSFMRPYYNSDCEYVYMSTGHNSVYYAYNNNGEKVLLNATHARPLSSDDNNWVAIPDAAMATRQIDLSGNVTIINPVYYTESGWPTPMPLQYDGTDTTKYVGSKHKAANEYTYTASDLEGYYDGNIIDDFVGSYAKHHTYNIVATDVDEGVIVDNYTSNGYKFKLSYGKINGSEYNNVTYMSLYNSSGTKVGEGVIANHDGKPMFSNVHYDGRHTWGVWDKPYPRDAINPEGEVNVALDSVVYTHARDERALAVATITQEDGESDADYQARKIAAYNNPSSRATEIAALTQTQKDAILASSYAMYGQQISDNEKYLTTGSDERVTTIKVNAPYYIDKSNPNAIVCLNDADFVAQGYTAGKYSFEFVNAKTSDGNSYTDEADYKANADSEGGYITYKLTGSVSNYFAYDSTTGKYREKGLELLITYTDGQEGHEYGEYKFPFVSPNPAWAHTLAATRNTQSETGNDRRSSYGVFNRFENSYGEATAISSPTLRFASTGSTSEEGWGTGISGYISDFSTHSFGDDDLNELSKIKTLFNFYDVESIAENSGSFAAWAHSNKQANAYTATPELINTQYYVDYSDTKNYLVNNSNGLITTNGSGVPTGYQFKMKTSNFLWANYSGSAIYDVTSYAKNTTGLTVSYSGTTANLPSSIYTEHWYGDDDDDGDFTTQGGVVETNRSSFKTNVATGGTRDSWAADEMLFLADERKDSDALFSNTYRNRFLYHFTNNASSVQSQGSKNDDGYIDGNKSTAPYFHNYSGQTAYETASNGKASTNAWQGTATFTGKDTLKQNTTATLPAIANADANDSITYSNGRLYDGYYYYYDSGRQDHRESWTDSETYAQNNTNNGYGQLDVTAENLANYILEMGNYHKINDTGVDGGRFLGSETYHYYNIGVDTCDKGAVREMVDTWANKKMNISRDGDRITTITGTGAGGAVEALNASDYSVASFNEYLDAIAEAYWFINNPKNTTYVSSEDGNTYAYSTAYGTFYGARHASIYTDDEGDNIFGNTTPADDAYSEDGKVHTDEVQAKLIADVIEAYENLFNVEDYTDAEDAYGKIEIVNPTTTKDAINIYSNTAHTGEPTITYAKGAYTSDSWNNFVNLVEGVSEDFDFYTNGDEEDEGYDKRETDVDYWRYTPISGKEYRQLLNIVNNADSALMPKVDIAPLNTALINKKGNNPSYEGTTLKDDLSGTPGYTYTSWKTMYDAVINGDAVVEDVTATPAPTINVGGTEVEGVITGGENFEIGKFKTTDYKTYNFNGIEYTAQVFTNTAFDETNYKPGGTVVSNCSDLQKDAYDSYTSVSGAELVVADSAAAYESYNTAYAVVASADRNKYTADGLDELDEALATRSRVYKTLDDDETDAQGKTELDRYNDYHEGNTKTTFKLTTTSSTDPITATLLSTANNLELAANKATYVKQLDVSYTVVKDGDREHPLQNGMVSPKPYYGDTQAFAVTNEQKAEGDSVVFSVQKYDSYENGEFVGAKGATKVTTNGSSISQVVNTPMAVTAVITSGGESSGVKLSIQNIYGKLVDVMYVPDGYPQLQNSDAELVLNSNGDVYDAPNVAFYTFEKWIKVTEEDGAVTYRAQYTVDGSMCEFNSYDDEDLSLEDLGGTLTNSSGGTVTRAKKDTKLTLNYTANDGFYAWVSKTKKSDAPNLAADSCYDVKKYQIVSYSPSYWFYATTDEDFYPVIKSGDDYLVKTGESTTEDLTYDVVDSITYLDFTGMEDDEDAIDELKSTVFKTKLDNHLPFISISYAQVTEEDVSGTTKNRFAAAMRMTYYDSNSDQQNDITNATLSTVFARKYSSYITENKGEYLFIKGASGVSTIKITNVLKNGQFSVTATYPLTDTGKAAIRGCVEYPITYTYNGTTSQVTLCDYTTINPLTYNTSSGS